VSPAILFLLAAGAAPNGVVIERATISWNELEKLLKKEGASAPKPAARAPLAHSISELDVTGDISRTRAVLAIVAEIEVLAKEWTIVPLIPQSFAVASAEVHAPPGTRGILVRDATGVSLVAKGDGHYRVDAELEVDLDGGGKSVRLVLAPAGLTGGRAELSVHGAVKAAGKTRWRSKTAAGQLRLEAALGAEGLDLELTKLEEPAPPEDAGAALEDLRAITVVSLGGRGVTRLTVLAKPGASRTFEAILPESGKLFRAWVGRDGIATERAVRGTKVVIPLDRPQKVELAYTFESTRLGVRGNWHVELPKLSVEAQGAIWDVWLPEGLQYEDTQSSMMESPACTVTSEPGLTRIDVVGRCFGFSRPVLEPAVAYVEGRYRQRF
jgi:hypothetical protein